MTPYCFFTPQKLAEELIKLIGNANIQTVIDISCGEGALLEAAHKTYPDASIVGVDIIETDLSQKIENSTFHLGDGIDYSDQCKKKYDLVLSNPPFGRKNEVRLDQGVIKELNRKRFECQMFNANLRLMKRDGWLIIILPVTFVIGETYNRVRASIATQFSIIAIVSLPDETFGLRNIKTYVLIVQNRKGISETKKYAAIYQNNSWNIEQQGSIPRSEIEKGDWQGEREIDDAGTITVFRGHIKSSDLSDYGQIVLHNATVSNGQWRPSIRHTMIRISPERIARIGDIIINRVGHSAGYWWLNEEGEFAVSDCILVLRGDITPDIMNMVSRAGRLNLQMRGVATQFITQDDVVSLVIKAKRTYREKK